MSEADLDTRVRTQAFQFLTEQTRLHGEVVPRDLLERGSISPEGAANWPAGRLQAGVTRRNADQYHHGSAPRRSNLRLTWVVQRRMA
jgi:hypothetical protein